MRSFFVLCILICFCGSCSATHTTLKNKNIGLDFSINNNIVALSQVTNVKDGVSYIAKPDIQYNLWTFSCKKSKDYAGEEIKLSADLAEKLTYDISKDRLTFTWKNVKTSDMTDGFDVVVTVNIKENNSYWDIIS